MACNLILNFNLIIFDNFIWFNDECQFFKWNLSENTEISKFIQSFFMFGLLIGNFVFGQLSDMFGRRYIFKIG